jgi:hypothetical protein
MFNIQSITFTCVQVTTLFWETAFGTFRPYHKISQHIFNKLRLSTCFKIVCITSNGMINAEVFTVLFTFRDCFCVGPSCNSILTVSSNARNMSGLGSSASYQTSLHDSIAKCEIFNQETLNCAREVHIFTAVAMKNTVFWKVTPCSLAEMQHFAEPYSCYQY